jgi:DnaD/phage-associated family protein
MEPFKGFPAGEMRFISIPDLFFTHVVPQIDNLVELKITLHILWLHTRQTRHLVSRDDLLADETLVQSLLQTETTVETALNEGLRRAVARGSLLHSRIQDDLGYHDVYFLNSERGRQAQAKLAAGELTLNIITKAEAAGLHKQTNIFKLYLENIGLFGPIMSDKLKEAEALYPPAWVEEAFQIAVEQNKRSWSYIEAILQRWAASGRNDLEQKGTSGGQRWYTEEEFKKVLLH